MQRRSLRKQFIQQLRAPSDGAKVPHTNQRNLERPFQRQMAHGLHRPFPEKGLRGNMTHVPGWPHACPQLRRDPEGRIQAPRVGFRGISLPLLKTASFQDAVCESRALAWEPIQTLHLSRPTSQSIHLQTAASFSCPADSSQPQGSSKSQIPAPPSILGLSFHSCGMVTVIPGRMKHVGK